MAFLGDDPAAELFRNWQIEQRLNAVDRRLHPEHRPMPNEWWASVFSGQDPDWEGLRSE